MNVHSLTYKIEGPFINGDAPESTDLPIEIGDIVSLVVGGPDMVVISTCECGTVEVAWVDSNGDVQIEGFPEEALVDV